MRIVLTFCIHFIIFFSTAQNQSGILDSISKVSIPEQSKLYNKLAKINQAIDLEKMNDYANKALQIAKNENQKDEQAQAYYFIGNYEYSKSNYEKAQIAFEKVVELINEDEVNNTDLYALNAKATSNLGLIMMERGKYFKALNNFKLAKTFFEKLERNDIIVQIDNNIGVVYRSVADFKMAVIYFEKAIQIEEKKPSASLGYAYANLGKTYHEMKVYAQADVFYNKALQIFTKYPDEKGLGELYNYMAELSLIKKDYVKAENHLKLAEKYFQSIDYPFGLSDTYYAYGKLNFQQNKLDQGLLYSKKMLSIGDELMTEETQANAHHLLSEIFEAKNNFSLALEHLKEYNRLKEGILSLDAVRENYETEKQLALQHQKAEYQVVKEKEARNKLFLIFGLILTTILIISFLLIKNHKKAKQAAILQKELAEFEQKALNLQMNPHFVFNCLAAISAFIVKNSNQDAIKYLSKFSKLMRLTLHYSNVSLISIDSEIEGLTNYLELEKLRFQNIFDYSITKDENIEDDCALPPMLLQM